MATHSCTWKRAESEAAAIFGARRAVLSGSSNRDDRCSSDSTHERLYIETKYRQAWSVMTLFRSVVWKTRKTDKTAVLALKEKGKEGMLICLYSGDLRVVVEEWLAAQTEETLLELEARVRVLRGAEG